MVQIFMNQTLQQLQLDPFKTGLFSDFIMAQVPQQFFYANFTIKQFEKAPFNCEISIKCKYEVGLIISLVNTIFFQEPKVAKVRCLCMKNLFIYIFALGAEIPRRTGNFSPHLERLVMK